MVSGLPPQKRTFVRLWVMSIAVIYVILAAVALFIVSGERTSSERNHRLRMDPTAVEPGKTPPDALPANTDFVPVNIGLYLDGVDQFSIKDSYWTATFYIWFTWKGDKSLDPGKNFQLVDAKIDKKELVESVSLPDGTNYQRFRVAARINKFFNTTRVPLDDHMLNIYVEDASRDASKLRYVADQGTNVSSRVKVLGYDITGFTSVVKAHTYKTTYGDPRVGGDTRTTVTEFVFAMTVKRSNVGFYLKLFIGLFAGVLLTLCSFFLRPSDTGPRFALPSAAYFGAVANAYLVNSQLPSSGQFGLTDLVTGIGLFTIVLCLVCSLTSGYYFLKRDDKEMSKAIDKVSWIAVGIGFLAINVALPIAAFG